MGNTWKNGLQLKKWVTLGKIGHSCKNCVTLRKIGHTLNNGSPLEIWDVLLGYTWCLVLYACLHRVNVNIVYSSTSFFFDRNMFSKFSGGSVVDCLKRQSLAGLLPTLTKLELLLSRL